ncbi:hypothetical protein B0O99DRAFT_506002 [Bisporella sp. PMI_857]|nr:hypothetical protein B0O99DRAFT_506002 [Bisporella sp. PMI_857]
MPAGSQQSEFDEKTLDAFEASSLSDAESCTPPAYTEEINHNTASNFASRGTFDSTTQLQIHARGVSFGYPSLCKGLDPIPVLRVHSGPSPYEFGSQAPQYLSLRLKQHSSSCALVDGSNPATPLISTIYRWCPNRSFKMRIFPPDAQISVEDAIHGENLRCEEVEVRRLSLISRTQRIATPYGTFEWRYGSRSERKEACNADSLLVLEKVDVIVAAGGKQEKKRTRVAQLVRNARFRTPGTTKSMAGNGGRLMLDLRAWAGKKEVMAKEVEAFVVASCICMLKREMDRNELSVIV